MMGRWIMHSFDKASLKTLDLSKRKFQYKNSTKQTIEEDGPIMVNIIFDRVNTSTRVWMGNLVADLSKFTLNNYDQNIATMSDAFDQTYKDILLKVGVLSNLESIYFSTFMNCENKEFSEGTQLKLIQWKCGIDKSFDEVNTDAVKR